MILLLDIYRCSKKPNDIQRHSHDSSKTKQTKIIQTTTNNQQSPTNGKENKMSKFTILEILEWEEDESTAASIYSHEGRREYQRCLEQERVEKEDNEWTKGLPFVCEANDIDEAIEKYTEAYCAWPNILVPIDVDYEEEEDEKEEEDDE